MNILKVIHQAILPFEKLHQFILLAVLYENTLGGKLKLCWWLHVVFNSILIIHFISIEWV